MVYCSCVSPPCVDLTPTKKEASFSSIDEQEQLFNSLVEKQRQLLRTTMERTGWCHVSVTKSQLSPHSALHSMIDNKFLKRDIEILFQEEIIQKLSQEQQVNKNNNPNNDMFTVENADNVVATYRGRTAESGAATSTKAEPKQSWEVPRCCHNGPSKEETKSPPKSGFEQQLSRLKAPSQWIKALHEIAVMVTQFLELPCNVLVGKETCDCRGKGAKNKEHNDDENGCQHADEKCNADLLRVFYYDAVQQQDIPILGSSPHTDWGSWTVVWQDDIGGLQTYCPFHDKWMNVPVPLPKDSEEEQRIQFVVHVGDVTSLAIGHAAATNQRNNQMTTTTTTATSAPRVLWPSPRHQVVSPEGVIPRASLVYFAYPPPCISLLKMEEALVPWWKKQQLQQELSEDHMEKKENDVVNDENKKYNNILVPYDHYSVLMNQSVEASSPSSCKDTYERVRSQPLREVFAEKWKQVQRA